MTILPKIHNCQPNNNNYYYQYTNMSQTTPNTA